jgi:hypothetical protein
MWFTISYHLNVFDSQQFFIKNMKAFTNWTLFDSTIGQFHKSSIQIKT